MKIHEMKQERARLIEEARDVLERGGESGIQKYDDLIATADEMRETIKRLEGHANIEADLNKREGRATKEPPQQDEGPTYRSLFANDGRQLRSGDFDDLESFVETVASNRHDPRLVPHIDRDPVTVIGGETRQQVGSVGGLGGFTVPEELAAMFIDAALEDEIVRPRATVWPMTSNTRHVPAWDGLDRSTNLFGGFTGEWLAEAAAANEQEAQVRRITLEANKLALYTSLSRELNDDGMGFAEQLQAAMRRAVAYILDESFLVGVGGTQPRGLINGATNDALIEVTRDTANQIQYVDLVNMYSRLFKGSAGRSSRVWLANHDTLPQLMTMVDAANNMLWQPNAREGAPGQLLGIPVVMTDKIPSLGNDGDLVLADLSHYAVGMRQEVVLDVSNAPGWAQDLISMRLILRVDGMPTWDTTLTPRNGTDTLSPFVALVT